MRWLRWTTLTERHVKKLKLQVLTLLGGFGWVLAIVRRRDMDKR